MATAEKTIIGIIGGQGKMGSLFKDFFQSQGLEVLISDLNTPLTNKELAQKSDLVIISVPIPQVKEVIAEVGPLIRPGAALADLTSIKVDPVNAMLASTAECEVIGLHPMFGNTNPIPGQTIVMCSGRGENWYKWLKTIFINAGAKVQESTPQDHDLMMSLVQGFVHFADIAFVHTLKDLNIHPDKFLNYASPPSELKISFAARLLAQDPTLYGSIQIYNDANIKTFKTYLANVQKLLDIDETKHLGAFVDYFKEAAEYLNDYKERALDETTWIIDRVIDNRNSSQESPQQNQQPDQTPEPKEAPQTATKPQPILKPTPDQIATLGPKNTYSDFTARQFNAQNKTSTEPFYCRQIAEVFHLVSEGQVKQGIVPIENSLNGTVRETIDSLLNYDVQIVQQLTTPIHHCIAGLKGADFSHATAIYSHPQAIHQCAGFIKDNCHHADLNYTSSTAAAMEKVITNNDISLLAIGSKQAALNYGLTILAESIEDQPNNQTNFIVIQKFSNDNTPYIADRPPQELKTSIIFSFADSSQPGILADVLQELSSRSITLTKIESRPLRKSIGDYYFYVDFKGSLADKVVQEAISVIKTKMAFLKVLGSY